MSNVYPHHKISHINKMKHFFSVFVIFFGFLAGCAVSAGGKSLYYTPERIKTAKYNVANYEWAESLMKRIMKGDPHNYYIGAEYTSAEDLAAKSDEFLWNLQPDTTIARFIPDETKSLCPVCDKGTHNVSYYCPWAIDPLNRPGKIQCRNCKTWFPNEKYPDDGSGVKTDKGCFYMMREYSHFVYMSYIGPGIAALSQAYLLTGDRVYAHKACVLLSRVAAIYPDYEERFARTWFGEYGGRHPRNPQHNGGLISDRIWECFQLTRFGFAFDALRNYPETDPELLQFLQSQEVPAKSNADWKEFLSIRIFRVAAKALFKERLKGNDGMHQAAAMAVALAMNEHSQERRPNTRDLIEFVYYGPNATAFAMDNLIGPDGGGHESPDYNMSRLRYIKVESIMEAIRNAHPELYPVSRYPRLWDSPKAERFFDFPNHVLLSGVTSPSIGDNGSFYTTLPKGKLPLLAPRPAPEYRAFAALRYQNPGLASSVFKDDKLIGGSLWEDAQEEQLRKLATGKKMEAQKNRLFDSYGVAILESGYVPKCNTLMLNYASINEHWQADALSINMLSNQVEHLRDVGYPISWNYTRAFDYHNLAHNTVTIDEKFQNGGMGRCRLFFQLPDFSGVTASHDANRSKKGKDGNPLADLFERTLLKIDLENGNFYAVDLFSVSGGTQHDQSWHSLPVKLELPDLQWKLQNGGTLAGEKIPEFGEWQDRWGELRRDVPSFVTAVKRAELSAPKFWTWRAEEADTDSFRLHVIPVSGKLEAIMGSGRTPAWGEGKNINFLFLRRETQFREPTLYLSVLEPFGKEPFIKETILKSRSPLTLLVRHRDGEDEFTFSDARAEKLTVRKIARRADQKERIITVNAASHHTPLLSPEWEQKAFTIAKFPDFDKRLKPGNFIRICNKLRSGMFEIHSVKETDIGIRIEVTNYPLLGRGMGDLSEGDRIKISASLVRSRWLGDIRFGSAYRGAWISADALPTRSITGATEFGLLNLAEPLTSNQLDAYEGKVVSIWQFGPGDTVEIPDIQEQ